MPIPAGGTMTVENVRSTIRSLEHYPQANASSSSPKSAKKSAPKKYKKNNDSEHDGA